MLVLPIRTSMFIGTPVSDALKKSASGLQRPEAARPLPFVAILPVRAAMALMRLRRKFLPQKSGARGPAGQVRGDVATR